MSGNTSLKPGWDREHLFLESQSWEDEHVGSRLPPAAGYVSPQTAARGHRRPSLSPGVY